MFAMKFFSKAFSLLVSGVLFTLSAHVAKADQVAAGSTVVMSVTADGTSPFTYQWLKDGTNLSGATGPILTILNVQNANAGNYSVLVANLAGSTTSTVTSLTIA